MTSSPLTNTTKSANLINYNYFGFLAFLIIPLVIYFGFCRKNKKLDSVASSENKEDSTHTL